MRHLPVGFGIPRGANPRAGANAFKETTLRISTGSIASVFAAAAVVAGMIGGGFAPAAGAEEIVTEPFLGIRHIQRVSAAPRPIFVNALEIDLSAPGLSFRLTPQVDGLPNGDETVTQTTRDFVEAQNAQLGINAHFFRLEHHSQQRPTNNRSLAVSDGNAYSPWDDGFRVGFNIDQNNVAKFIRRGAEGGFDTRPQDVDLYNAFAGNLRLVTNGVAITEQDLPRRPGTGFMADRHPRTAVGLTADNKLLLVTVDGRQNVFSEGVFIDELGAMMRDLGARNAVNLDGGGSTTMVGDYYGDLGSDGLDRGTLLLNSPTGRGPVGSERNNGTNLAVFAAPNPGFVPRSAAPSLGSAVTMLADFEVDEGTFASGPISGSNRNISRASIEKISNDGYFGEGSQRIALEAGTDGIPMSLRNLSGGGNPANNTDFDSEGYVGFFVKVVTPGLEEGDVAVSLVVDDGASHEQAALQTIAVDGDWHLVEWSLEDAAAWSSFANGNGQIDEARITIDSMYLRSPTEKDVIVYWDGLVHSPDSAISALIPEPASTLGLTLCGMLLLVRRR